MPNEKLELESLAGYPTRFALVNTDHDALEARVEVVFTEVGEDARPRSVFLTAGDIDAIKEALAR